MTKYFANVEKILTNVEKILTNVEKYFANVGNFGKILCIEPGHEKSPMEKH